MQRRLTICILTAVFSFGLLGITGVAIPENSAPEYEAYVVQSQQTLASIAAEYGISTADLASFNRCKVTEVLQPGQIIMVPLSAVFNQQSVRTPPPAPALENPTTKIEKPKLAADMISGYRATVTAKSVVLVTKPVGGANIDPPVQKGQELLVIDETSTFYGVLMKNGTIGWIPKLAVDCTNEEVVAKRPTPPETLASSGRPDIVDTAFEYLGIPYKYGGRLPNNIDCSLLVQTVFHRHGINLPRTAAQQFAVGAPVATTDLIPGDRLYFYDPNRTKIGHTGIYAGNGRFIHASSNRGKVAVDDISNPTYVKKYAGARR